MGSSNFLQHNPGAVNQEDDSAYVADSTRTGGIGKDQIMPSPWMNKIWYQASTFIAAFSGALANKGYTLSDANLATLEAVLANVLTSADIKPPLVSVPFTPTPVFNAAIANGFDFVLTGNVTSSTLTGQTVGQVLTFCITNTGGFSFAFPPGFNDAQSVPANTTSVQAFIVREDGSIWPYAQEALNFTPVQQGTGVDQLGNIVKLGWSGSQLKATVDNSDLGAFVFLGQFANVFAINGMATLPGGLILKWGTTGTTSGAANIESVGVSFNPAFPNNCFAAFATADYLSPGSHGGTVTMVTSRSRTGLTVTFVNADYNNHNGIGQAYWFAIGN